MTRRDEAVYYVGKATVIDLAPPYRIGHGLRLAWRLWGDPVVEGETLRRRWLRVRRRRMTRDRLRRRWQCESLVHPTLNARRGWTAAGARRRMVRAVRWHEVSKPAQAVAEFDGWTRVEGLDR